MAIKFLNWNGETIDEIDSGDFKDERAFKKEQDRLRDEYALAGMSGNWSQRPCKGWND